MTTTAQYEQFFDEMDTDGGGSVDFGEMKDKLKKRGFKDCECQVSCIYTAPFSSHLLAHGCLSTTTE